MNGTGVSYNPIDFLAVSEVPNAPFTEIRDNKLNAPMKRRVQPNQPNGSFRSALLDEFRTNRSRPWVLKVSKPIHVRSSFKL
jgi:hypothetical protein